MTTPATSTTSAHEADNIALAAASSKALLRALSHAKVKFLRYLTLDVCGNVRCKVIPVDYLRKYNHRPGTLLLAGVALVKVSIGGLPSYADHMLSETSGLTAAGTVRLRPDLATLRILPYAPDSAVVLGCLHEVGDDDGAVADVANSSYSNSDVCCRSLLQRVVHDALVKHNTTFTVGVELEFILYEADVKKNGSSQRPVEQSNFADTTLLNQQQAFVSAVYDALQQQEICIELLHSESASGQMEIVLEHIADPVMMADHVVLARETIKAVARQHGMKAIFLPKVNAMQAGNGCHVHLSLYDAATGRSEFAATSTGGDGGACSRRRDSTAVADAAMSPTGQSFVEGILQHLPSIMAVTMPTANSFRRVGPGCWTGSRNTWAVDDKEAPLRVIVAAAGAAKNNNSRVEFKLCDSTANLYLALSCILTAGLHGVSQGLSLRAAMPRLSNERASRDACDASSSSSALPTSINESLDLLERNELLKITLSDVMMKGYLAVRRAEAARAANMTLEEEIKEALDRA